MDSSGKHGRGRGIGRVLQKGGQGVGEAKRKRRQSVCSATVRHAGMCPAAAAGSEDDDRSEEASATTTKRIPITLAE